MSEEILKPLVPTPDEMLEKLNKLDTEMLDLVAIENMMRGKMVWVNILTAPVSMMLLALLTLLGYIATDYLILSFIVSAILVFMASKGFDSYDREIRVNARKEVEGRIKDIEGEFGFMVHFEMFLPTRYRHLIQTLKRRKYYYIEQYVQAITLLQKKLDAAKFTEAWYRVYPETKPAEEELGKESTNQEGQKGQKGQENQEIKVPAPEEKEIVEI